MRVVIALTYYRPHVSGLTIYAERLARGLAARGHEITVLTSCFAADLPSHDRDGGIEIVRVPVLRKLSKGVIMPTFPLHAQRVVRGADVVNIHMPQLEASLLAALARAHRRPAVLTYQCDLQLPIGTINRLVEASLRPLNRVAARLADAIVVSSADYAASSPFLRRYGDKTLAIQPVVTLPAARPDLTHALAQRWNLRRGVKIGFAARFAAEKGVEYLFQALPALVAAFPDLRVVFTGAYRDTVGEQAYAARLAPMIEQFRDHLVFLDLLTDAEMPSFYALCDALVVTSLNSTEAYGLVQPEAMLAGTPVVATDLPGVREPVRRTGMGRIVAPRDAAALADALIDVLRNRDRYVRPHAEIAAAFDPNDAFGEYEALFARLARRRQR
jgi:glycosyltransferase involved in cell wall biosynthesis